MVVISLQQSKIGCTFAALFLLKDELVRAITSFMPSVGCGALDFCDVPQLFVARDAFDTIYLCLLYDDEASCQYTVIRISSNRLQLFLNGEEDLRNLYDNPETPFEYFDVEYRDDNYYFEPHQAAFVGEERLPLSGYKMSGDEHEAVVVHIPVKDRNLLKDLVRKFGWACVF